MGTQQKQPLAGVRVAVVGAGRIGVELIRNLALMGVERMDIYERDARAADSLRNRCTVHEGDFWDTLTLARLLQYDFAFCTLADAAARSRMNRKCLVTNVSLVVVRATGSLAHVSAYPFNLCADSACAECVLTSSNAQPTPIASLQLAVLNGTRTAPQGEVATASVAAALAAALVARIAAGAHGAGVRDATLDASLGQGRSVEVLRDPQCPRCSSLQRPIPIVQTRNRWVVSATVAETCPAALEQRLQLSDEIAGLSSDSYSVRELAALFQGGPVPAKFALTAAGGRTICLAFEERELPAPSAIEARAAIARHLAS
jgi:bacteriocin biosynthesis cyclodehydratase domain-containing protein